MTNLARVLSPKLTFKSALLLLAGGLAVAAAGNASASEGDVPSVAVHYSTSSLNTDTGAQALYYRLVRAAEEVCEGQSPGTRVPTDAEMKCRAQAVSKAVEKIHNPRLVALSNSTTKSG
jgi:UrcA family protein